MVRLFDPMQASPIGWLADLAMVGTPAIAASQLNAAGAIAVSLFLGGLAVVVGTWTAERHWFSDPALAGVEKRKTTAEDAKPGLERTLAPTLGASTASLVVLAWRRALRSPLKLLYAAYPLLFLVGLFADIVQTGQVPTYLPYGIVLFVAWAAGVIFTLNPLGDQGAVLSSTLLSRVDGHEFVRAHVIASLVFAIPPGIVATAVVAYVSPVDTETAILLVVAAPVVMVLSALLSIGVGMAFPRFETTRVAESMKTVLPSRWGFVLFSLHLFLTAGAATAVYEPFAREFAAAIISWALPFGLSVSADVLYWVAAVVLVPLLIAPLWAYRYAVRRFDRYTTA